MRDNNNQRWSRRDDIILKRMRTEGASWKEIAAYLGRTEAGCAYRAAQLRPSSIPRPKTVTICENCGLASGRRDADGNKCPWADRLEPVPGWEGVRVTRSDWSGADPREGFTYFVRACPHYTDEEPPADYDEDACVALYGEIIGGMVKDFQRAETGMYGKSDMSKRRAAASDFLHYDKFFGDTAAGEMARRLLRDYPRSREMARQLA